MLEGKAAGGGTVSTLRTPLAICLGLLVLLLAGGFATEKGEPAAKPVAAAPASAAVPAIARRVETIRRLRFKEVPKPVRVRPAAARREGLAELDRSYPAARRRADEEAYKLLGLLRPADDLRAISGSVYGEQVAGYYDPRSGALRVVEGSAPPNHVLDETTIAHELNHALEDQAFDLDLDDLDATGDGSLAYSALVEGSATALMTEYQRRYFKPSEALGAAASAGLAAPSTANLPPFITAQLLFPYLDGDRFIQRLYATGRGWTLVDLALRDRPPVSSEQILHPEKYLRVELPDRVRLPGVGRALGEGWRRVVGETFGEWQTRELLARAGGTGAGRAAAGWGGDRIELWRRGPFPAPRCAAPCAARDVLVLRWRWDTARDADEFARALRPAARGGLVRRGDARTVTLVLAADPALAARVARTP